MLWALNNVIRGQEKLLCILFKNLLAIRCSAILISVTDFFCLIQYLNSYIPFLQHYAIGFHFSLFFFFLYLNNRCLLPLLELPIV